MQERDKRTREDQQNLSCPGGVVSGEAVPSRPSPCLLMMFIGVEAEGVKSASSTSGVGARPRNRLTTCNRKTSTGKHSSVFQSKGYRPRATHCNRNERPRLLHPSQPVGPSLMRVGTHCPQESSLANLPVGDGKSPKPTARPCFVGSDAPHSVNASKATGDAHPVRGSVMRTPREIVL